MKHERTIQYEGATPDPIFSHPMLTDSPEDHPCLGGIFKQPLTLESDEMSNRDTLSGWPRLA
jgi:hypothetical protein